VRVKERPVVSTTVRLGFAVSTRRTVRLVTTLLILAAVVAPALAMPRSARAASAVTTSALNLRAGPSTDQRIRLVMPEGAEVEIIGGPRHGFYKVAYNGREGWASGDYLDVGGGSGDGGGASSGSTLVTSALNLRTGPSTSSSIILVMPEGSHVDLTGDSDNGFLGVVYRGTYGWAHSDYLDGGTSAADDGGDSLPTGDGGGSATVDSALNLRTGPGTSYSIILVMSGGADVELTGDQDNGFYGVIYNGTRGWAYGDYLNIGGGNDSVDGSDGWSTDEIVAIIYAAAAQYGQNGDDMLRVAQCESGLDPYNVTPPYSASGLFQFLPGTWASTPFADQDIFDPVANANAAGWMWSVGRRGEWVCQ
jgi:uncharacterized protein YraI